MKRSLLFIGHDFHRRTKSNSFILDLIQKSFELEICSIIPDYEENGAWLSSLKKKHYDVVLCWQVMPPIDLLKKFCSFEFGVFFPMADYYYLGRKDVSAPIWEQYQDFQIISFSKKMHEELTSNGFSSHFFQYFPEPVSDISYGDSNAAFFWQRVSHINIYSVLTLLKNYSIKHLHIHRALDPHENYVSLPYEYQGCMDVSYSSWFESKKDMRNCMDRAAIYMASRYCEGIGMSFLEAMARGRCVIAPNETTFNEYIEHGKTGFLFIPSDPQPIEKKEIQEIQKNSYLYICNGYKEWIKKREEIVPLFTQKSITNSIKIHELKQTWNEKSREELNRKNIPQNLKRHLPVRIQKIADIIRGKSEIYHKIGEKKICGIRYFTKMERCDKKKILIFFFGFPLFSIELIEEN